MELLLVIFQKVYVSPVTLLFKESSIVQIPCEIIGDPRSVAEEVGDWKSHVYTIYLEHERKRTCAFRYKATNSETYHLKR